MTTAKALLNAIAEGREQDAWATAQGLAKTVLELPLVTVARAVLDGGPFALRRAVELAELVLESEFGGQRDVIGELGWRPSFLPKIVSLHIGSTNGL